MPRIVVCRELGPPERLRLEEVPSVPLKPGEVRVAIRAAGIFSSVAESRQKTSRTAASTLALPISPPRIAGAISGRHTVSRSHRRIGRLPIDHPGPAAGQDRLLSPD